MTVASVSVIENIIPTMYLRLVDADLFIRPSFFSENHKHFLQGYHRSPVRGRGVFNPYEMVSNEVKYERN